MSSYTYLMSGSSAVKRFTPVFEHLGRFENIQHLDDSVKALDLLWMNTSTKAFADLKSNSTCYNHLSGTVVLEDKCKLALVQTKMDHPSLDAHVVQGQTGFTAWLDNRTLDADMWIVKDGLSNGAAGLWILNKDNQSHVTQQLEDGTEYVIQQYVNNPMLWRGRKFHFRCYAVLKGDLQMFLYKHAFLHAANKPYDYGRALDDDVHITNCCANKDGDEFAGEIIVDLEKDYPVLYPKMRRLLACLVDAIRPFMGNQRSAEHFEWIGFDFIADDQENVWLIEANCPPGMDSATGLERAERFHHEMACSLVESFICQPLDGASRAEAVHFAQDKGWVAVNESATEFHPTTDKAGLGRNVLSFTLFQKKLSREA